MYFRPDLEVMLQPAGHRRTVPVSLLMRSAADGLLYEITQGWELRPGHSWQQAVLIVVAVPPDVCLGPGWYDVIDVLC